MVNPHSIYESNWIHMLDLDQTQTVPLCHGPRRRTFLLQRRKGYPCRYQRIKIASKKLQLAKLLKPQQVPKNTDVSTHWVMKNFTDWYYSKSFKTVPRRTYAVVMQPAIIEQVVVCLYLNRTNEKYPPRTIYSLLTGVLRHMRAENPGYPNFLGKNCFAPVHSYDQHFAIIGLL